jgi:hypothetical protein
VIKDVYGVPRKCGLLRGMDFTNFRPYGSRYAIIYIFFDDGKQLCWYNG